jgi:hypothetical protein
VKKLMALSMCLVVGAELLALLAPDRRFVLWISGVAVALAMLGVRRVLAPDMESEVESNSDDLGASLRSWLTITEAMIRWSESTRSDWDRHLRPVLARRFAMTTGHTQAKDPAVFHATGRMLFGPELWGWVDPNNVTRTGGHEPGPGRAALEEILQRLEQI